MTNVADTHPPDNAAEPEPKLIDLARQYVRLFELAERAASKIHHIQSATGVALIAGADRVRERLETKRSIAETVLAAHKKRIERLTDEMRALLTGGTPQ
jgi:hypothetical protein